MFRHGFQIACFRFHHLYVHLLDLREMADGPLKRAQSGFQGWFKVGKRLEVFESIEYLACPG
jgi:hypothetical protein